MLFIAILPFPLFSRPDPAGLPPVEAGGRAQINTVSKILRVNIVPVFRIEVPHLL